MSPHPHKYGPTLHATATPLRLKREGENHQQLRNRKPTNTRIYDPGLCCCSALCHVPKHTPFISGAWACYRLFHPITGQRGSASPYTRPPLHRITPFPSLVHFGEDEGLLEEVRGAAADPAVPEDGPYMGPKPLMKSACSQCSATSVSLAIS